MIKDLVKLANELDEMDLHEEADFLDEIINQEHSSPEEFGEQEHSGRWNVGFESWKDFSEHWKGKEEKWLPQIIRPFLGNGELVVVDSYHGVLTWEEAAKFLNTHNFEYSDSDFGTPLKATLYEQRSTGVRIAELHLDYGDDQNGDYWLIMNKKDTDDDGTVLPLGRATELPLKDQFFDPRLDQNSPVSIKGDRSDNPYEGIGGGRHREMLLNKMISNEKIIDV